MPDILKTLESWREPKRVLAFLRRDWVRYFFSLGRGRPKREPILRVYFTYKGRIRGCFLVEQLVQNAGQLPKLRTMDGGEDTWQIKPDAWVAVCKPPFFWLTGQRIYHEGFRGWRYFDLEAYRKTPDARLSDHI